MPSRVMVFAAGRGTRMAPLTNTQPKPLIKVAGQSLLDRALDLTDQPWITHRVVNIHYRGAQIRDHLSARDDIQISDETDALLETGGGLRKALPQLGAGPVFTLNSDAVWTDPDTLAYLRAAWDPVRMDALLLLVPGARALGHSGPGDFELGPSGELSRGGPYVYTGAQIVDPAGLSAMSETAFSLNKLWNLYAESGRLFGTVYPGHWADVGTPAGLETAETLLGGSA